MFESPSLMYRIAIGKTIGLIVGAGGFIFLNYFSPELDWMLRWGVLFWYITLGAIIGVYGVFTRTPCFAVANALVVPRACYRSLDEFCACAFCL